MIALSGKSVLITGGSRGVGRATAVLFAQAGADVGITYHTRREAAEDVAREIRRLGRRAVIATGDHADPLAAEALVGSVAHSLGGLDFFVANAGIWPAEEVPLSSMTPERWRDTLRANLDGIFATTRAALRELRKGGSVVLISSTAGQRGEAFHADYAATKGAVIALTKSLAIECAPDLTVNCVAPGWIETDMSAPAMEGDARARIEAGIPLRHIASAADIAGPILFLCSPLARQITGEIVNVNGGSVLCG